MVGITRKYADIYLSSRRLTPPTSLSSFEAHTLQNIALETEYITVLNVSKIRLRLIFSRAAYLLPLFTPSDVRFLLLQ